MPAAEGAERRYRRSWPQRLLIALIVFVALTVLGTASGYAYLRWRFRQINKVHLPQLSADDPGQPMNVLLVGSDSRSRLTGSEAVEFGKDKVGGERSDTVMVLHIDPRQTKAAILSIPRDLYVSIAGENRMDRINTAITSGGPARLIATIRQNLGIRVNHYVEVDFVGFKGIVDAVGGVKLYVPAPAKDDMSGLSIKRPGCVELDGNQALAWSRSRHYQYFESGRWREDPRGDLGRIQRQQELVRRMLKTATESARYNPIQLNRLIGIGIKNVTIDSAMSTKDILNLARRFRSLDPDSVDMLTLPTEDAKVRIGGDAAAVLKVQYPEAREALDRLTGRVPATGPRAPAANLKPSDVRLRLLNGTGFDGLAGRVSGDLQRAGFVVADSGDADIFRYERTVIRYDPRQVAKAQLLQHSLGSGAQLTEERNLKTVDVVLVVGSDYSGVRARPAGAGEAGPATTLPKPEPVPVPHGSPPQQTC